MIVHDDGCLHAHRPSDHGLPQLRPRLFMIGFRDPKIDFNPPSKTKLSMTMSDIFRGKVDREIGFTLRVGGRKSGINDRRNWDTYIVDNEIKVLSSKEGKKMQGFPSDFHFPVSETQAMKQLGNSVAVNAIRDYAKQIILSLNYESDLI